MPATSGASGPTTVRSMRSLRAKAEQAGEVVGADGHVVGLGVGAGVAGGAEDALGEG